MTSLKSNALGKLMSPGSIGLKRSAYTMFGGALPITTIPMMASVAKNLNNGMRGLANFSKSANIPFYLNSMRRANR
jgi:hypothetical protein